MRSADIIDHIFVILQRYGSQTAGGRVSLLDHVLQTAAIAEGDGAPAALIAAAVLHEYGHVAPDLQAGRSQPGTNGQHAAPLPGSPEEAGAHFLARYFVPAVTEPIRLHDAARRYLWTVTPAYFDTIASAAPRHLHQPGSLFSDAEVRAFEASPHFAAAIRLRQYDGRAWTPGAPTQALGYFRTYLVQTRNPAQQLQRA